MDNIRAIRIQGAANVAQQGRKQSKKPPARKAQAAQPPKQPATAPKKKAGPEPGKPKGYAQCVLDAVGVDAICEGIGEGKSLTAIAKYHGVSIGTLLMWVDRDTERSARVHEARSLMARHWEEEAERVIVDASSEFELKKARELAHHYRWRASRIRPGEFGDKVDHTVANPDGSPLLSLLSKMGRSTFPMGGEG